MRCVAAGSDVILPTAKLVPFMLVWRQYQGAISDLDADKTGPHVGISPGQSASFNTLTEDIPGLGYAHRFRSRPSQSVGSGRLGIVGVARRGL